MNEDVPQPPELEADIVFLCGDTKDPKWQAIQFKQVPKVFLSGDVSDAEFFEKMEKLAADAEMSNAAKLNGTYLLTARHHSSGSLKPKRKPQKRRHQRLFRFWELFPFLLPLRVRQETYEPAHQDLLAKYLEARRFRSPLAKRFITLCFILQTAFMVLDCVRVMITSKVVKWAMSFLHWRS
jgi:hypothetical protein